MPADIDRRSTMNEAKVAQGAVSLPTNYDAVPLRSKLCKKESDMNSLIATQYLMKNKNAKD
jgi:hypothetical protein